MPAESFDPVLSLKFALWAVAHAPSAILADHAAGNVAAHNALCHDRRSYEPSCPREPNTFFLANKRLCWRFSPDLVFMLACRQLLQAPES
jgi:hypothetical protein